jgi:hypothetical protein
MPTPTLEAMLAQLRQHWRHHNSDKIAKYVGKFFNRKRRGSTWSAQVVGNHGTYSVSIDLSEASPKAGCSCYIGGSGYCHHCAALARTAINEPDTFIEVLTYTRDHVHDLKTLSEYLEGATLEFLLDQLKVKGITMKAIAEALGTQPRLLSSMKTSELRGRTYSQLGTTKLACIWLLDNLPKLTIPAPAPKTTRSKKK